MDSWICPTCKTPVQTRYCPSCGERALGKHDLTLVGLIEQAIEAVGHLDNRIFRSVERLAIRPGSLTVSYVQGQRKPYVPPLQLFLVANLIFFGLYSAAGVHVFSTPLYSHLHQQYYSGVAGRLVTRRLEATRKEIEQYEPVFDHAVALNAKSLVVLMVVPFTMLTLILFSRSGVPFAVHVVFALHFFAFLLLFLCVLLPVGFLAAWLGASGASGSRMDVASVYVLIAICAVYLYLAIGAVFGTRGIVRLASVAVLAVSSAVIVIGYRFALLVITLYAT